MTYNDRLIGVVVSVFHHEVVGSIPGTSTILNVDWSGTGLTQPREDN